MRRSVALSLLLTVALIACSGRVATTDELVVDRCDRDYWGDDLPASCDASGEQLPETEEPGADPDRAFRYVLIEDLSADNANGATPGADIDAIGLELRDGKLVWAESVEDFEFGGANNEHVDANELLGPPDASACDVSGGPLDGFASLGGVADNSYVIVSFGRQTFGSGAAVVVWELGPTNCGDAQPNWRDDETAISVSASTDAASFELIGSVGFGSNAIIIP